MPGTVLNPPPDAYIYLSNDNDQPQEVFFDDLQFWRLQGLPSKRGLYREKQPKDDHGNIVKAVVRSNGGKDKVKDGQEDEEGPPQHGGTGNRKPGKLFWDEEAEYKGAVKSNQMHDHGRNSL